MPALPTVSLNTPNATTCRISGALTYRDIGSLIVEPGSVPRGGLESRVLWIGLALDTWVKIEQATERTPKVACNRVQAFKEGSERAFVVVQIQSLDPAPVDVIQPVVVVVEEEDDAFVASFVEANMNASGETQREAVEMLKDVIASSFRLFVENEAILGKEPKRQLEILRRFLRMR